MVTPLVTVFLVRAHRSTEVARALLGKVTGVLVADRSKAYRYWPADASLCGGQGSGDRAAVGGAGAHAALAPAIPRFVTPVDNRRPRPRGK